MKKIRPSMDWIVYDDNPILKERSEDLTLPIGAVEEATIAKMVAYIDASYENKAKKYKIKPGIGIAAIQLGIKKRIIYIHFNENEVEHKYLIANPIIIKEFNKKTFIKDGEGCLSVKDDAIGYSIRKAKIIVKALNLFDFQEIEIEAHGLLACCLQHEIDHLNGILYYDRINKFKPFYKEDDWEEI
ncbi:MAG: peptide deformylase [Mycoplasmoidaceae bacterium]